MKSPFIIIGMHRSGTSLLARLLEASGIFMGVVKDHNFEAMHFLSLNQQSIWSAGGDWHHPVVPDALHWKTMPAQVLYHEHFKVNDRLAKWQLAWRKPRWGWKDPRNTFTLPMWLSLFPQAKVLHLHREREAVVSSLQRRNQLMGEVFQKELREEAFCRQLWQKYVDQANSYAPQLPGRYLAVAYEKLRDKDPETIRKLEGFCQIQLNDALDAYLI